MSGYPAKPILRLTPIVVINIKKKKIGSYAVLAILFPKKYKQSRLRSRLPLITFISIVIIMEIYLQPKRKKEKKVSNNV